MKRAFMFPGQGSQIIGMGHSLATAYPSAKAVFDEVDEALGQPLSQLMWHGTQEELTLTENAQPALMAISLAVIKTLESSGYDLAGNIAYVAGHSLGEYSALAAAGVFSLADTARLLKIRGQAMQQAVPKGQGSMAAIMGFSFPEIVAIASEAETAGGVCRAANDNAPGQVVVSGSADAVARACALAKEQGAKRAVELAVSAPFHCPLMQPAADKMAQALADIDMRPPLVPLIANVTAQPSTDAEVIRKQLVTQVTGVVRWRESVEYLAANGVTELAEIGAGKVLSSLARRIDRDLQLDALGDPETIDAFLSHQAGK